MKKIIFSMLLLPGLHSTQAQGIDREQRKQKRMLPATKFILSLSPVHITEENIGIGASAELFTDTKGVFSVVLPVSYAFSSPNTSHYYGGSYYYPGNYPFYRPSDESSYYNSKGMIYFYPGFKVYPAGANKKVSYAAGANLVIGIGSADKITTKYRIDSSASQGMMYYYQTAVSQDKSAVSRMKMGVLVSNSLNLRPSNHLYMGIDLGVGYSYMDSWDGSNFGTGAMVQLGVKFGFVQ
ncbi:MAG TPA: hypothetical protein VL098_12055 [Flavipsychrobacter sp.]|nr:hypothetical protein [Flavipsychrobacter sp.]